MFGDRLSLPLFVIPELTVGPLRKTEVVISSWDVLDQMHDDGIIAVRDLRSQPFTIDFDNQDSGTPHNIQIKDAGGTSVFKGDIVTGPIQTSYHVDALAAGTYSFVCDVHPTAMTGTLTVK